MATGVTVIKRIPYRGDPNEEYSNSYYFTGSTPGDAAAWRSLFDNLVTQEKTLYPAAVSVVRGYGYDSDAADAHAVWSVDLTVSPDSPVPGTLGVGSSYTMPMDDAFWVRWKTSRTTSKGKPIYLRKYFHPAQRSTTAPNADTLDTTQRTAALAFGLKMRDGTFGTGRTLVAPGHSSDVLTSHAASVYITTRTLKRRGKRPGA